MATAVLNSPLVELTLALEKAAAAPAESDAAAASVADRERALDLVRAMIALPTVTADELRITKAGLLLKRISKLTAHEAELATEAKKCMDKWKAAVAAQAPPAIAAAPMKTISAAKSTPPATTSTTATQSAAKKEAKVEPAAAASKKRKADREASASPIPKPSTDKNAPLHQQHPQLARGPYALFQTDDATRDKMQFMLWTALGDPPQRVFDELKATTVVPEGVDLSAYKSVVKQSPKVKAEPSPSPSPPPVGDMHLSDTTTTTTNVKSESATDGSAAIKADPSTAKSEAASSEGKAEPSKAPNATPSPPPANATSNKSNPRTVIPTLHSRLELAFKIEKAMYETEGFRDYHGGVTGKYLQKYRDLAPQLKDPNNEELRVRIFLGLLSPSDLIKATTHELAPAALREQRKKEADFAREDARCDNNNVTAATDAFFCEVCEQRNCTFFQQQTRGADEPMTIFVTCLNCGNKFRSGDGER